MTAKSTAITMIDYMMSPDNPTNISLPRGSSVALFLNNLGSTSLLEMNILIKEAVEYLELKSYRVDRAYSGAVVTSQEMAGFSITIFLIDEERKKYLDMETTAPAWQFPYLTKGVKDRKTPKNMLDYPWLNEEKTKRNQLGVEVSTETSNKIYNALSNVCKKLIASEKQLNHLDSTAGDGDCGSTHKSGAAALLKKLDSGAEKASLCLSHPYNMFMEMADVLEDSMGGSSGALYSLFLTAAANPFLEDASKDTVVEAFNQGLDAITKYGLAHPGDRTMLDPLNAAYLELKKNPSALTAAVKAAETEASATAMMTARAGRASYVESTRLTEPDPGAVGVSIWMRAAWEGWTTAV